MLFKYLLQYFTLMTRRILETAMQLAKSSKRPTNQLYLYRLMDSMKRRNEERCGSDIVIHDYNLSKLKDVGSLTTKV